MAIAMEWAVDDASGNAAELVSDAVLAPSASTALASTRPAWRPHLAPNQNHRPEV